MTTAPAAAAEKSREFTEHGSQSCAQLGAAEYKCESPGNAKVNDAPPVTNFFPQGDD